MSDTLPAQVVQWFADSANWQGPDGVWNRLTEHLILSAISLVVAALIAIPIGLVLGRSGRGQAIVINVTNAGRAIPVYAVLVLLVIGPLGLSVVAIIVALVLFAIPPILTNTYTGVREVDLDVVDAGRGMGLSGRQLLRSVQIPLAMPLIVTGLRLAAVQIIATATIAALVAGGGLGRIITSGFGTQDPPKLVAGAILVAVLALLIEALFAWWAAVAARRTGRTSPADERANATSEQLVTAG